MEQIIYGDVLFIVNFSMDFLTLFLLGKIIHAKISVFSLILSAAIGALYAVISIFCKSGMLGFLINISVSMLMTYIAYGMNCIISLLKNTLILYTLGFLIGGSMTALFTLANQGLAGRNIILNGQNRIMYSDIPFFTFVIIAVLSLFLSYLCGILIKKKTDISSALIKIEFMGKSIEVRGLVDSGNLLCEPAGGRPVVIFSYTALEALIPPGLKPLFSEQKLGILEFAGTQTVKRIRIIPISDVGSKGLLVGFIPDKAYINSKEKEICIACSPDKESFGELPCLIPASIL